MNDMRKKNGPLVLAVGEVLFDIFPDSKRMGGAPFNFAFHLHGLGFPVIFASRVGPDENGDAIVDFMEKVGLSTRFIQRDPDHRTGYVQVELDENGVPDFTIAPAVAYDYLEYRPELAELIQNKADLIGYGTLIQRGPTGADTLAKIFENRHPQTRGFYDINLRKDAYSLPVIEQSLQACDILKLSQEELDFLQTRLSLQADARDGFVAALQERYAIDWVSLTRGEAGSRLYTQAATFETGVPPRRSAHGDTVGAGDAYAAMLAAGYLLGWPSNQILERAAEFAGAICEIQGAIPSDMGFYQAFQP